MRILIIEDDKSTADSLCIVLKHAAYEVDRVDMGRDGISLAIRNDYGLIILDLGLPDLCGFEVLQKLRSLQINTPTLILTGLDNTASRIKGFRAGADDYLTKPFDHRELVARINAIIRRSEGNAEHIIRVGKITVNLDARTVEVGGNQVNLTGREYRILALLSLRKGATLSKAAILDHIYGGHDTASAKVIDVFVCKIRQKLALATGGDNCIETDWGFGYRLRYALD